MLSVLALTVPSLLTQMTLHGPKLEALVLQVQRAQQVILDLLDLSALQDQLAILVPLVLQDQLV
jgi:hypothetical protein